MHLARSHRARRLATAAVLAVLGAWSPWASASPRAPQVAVLTMTPGPRLFERFGHTAIRVDDRVYNFGTFDGEDPHLSSKFLRHTLEYWLSVQPFEAHLRQYENRDITVQELSLDDAEARALAESLERNALPENRAYRYDFFLDNCATRVRDLVDGVTGGALREAGRAPGAETYREQVESVLSPSPLVAYGISLLLSAFVDQATTRWQEAFLPRDLERLLADGRRRDGRPLVARTWVVRGALSPHGPTSGSRVIEVLLSLLLLGPPLGALALHRASSLRRVLTGAGVSAFGLAGGLLGLAVLLAALSPYPCARGNANLLLLHPPLLALVPLGARAAAGRARAASFARAILAASFALAAVDVALHGVGVARQHDLGLALVVLAVEGLLLLGLARKA